MGANPKLFVIIGLLAGGILLSIIALSTTGWAEGKSDGVEVHIGLGKGCVKAPSYGISNKCEKLEKKVAFEGKEITNPFKSGGDAATAFTVLALIASVVAVVLCILQVVGVAVPGLAGGMQGLAVLGASAGAVVFAVMAWVLYAGIVYGSKYFKKYPMVKLHASYSYFFVFISSLVFAGAAFVAFLNKGGDAYREI